nr:hypothetical protein [uncultured Pedobacter sp.]
MITKCVTIEEGFALATHYQVAYLNCEPKFVKIIAGTFNVEPICLVAFNKDKPILGMVLYAKGKSIVHPSIYIYTAIWQTSNSVIRIENAFLSILNKLQADFKYISLLLPPKVTDIRPFIYCGFKSDVKYTYINNLNDINPSSEVKSRINKANKLGVNFNFDEDSEEILNHIISSFLKLGYKRSYIKTLENFIYKLMASGYLVSISARLNNELLASGYVLLDKANQNAMNLFITSNKSHYQTGVHSSLYVHNLSALKGKGFLTNDLFGASTKGIGDFKSSFNGELTPFYHVRYSYLRWRIVSIVNKIKLVLMKINANK